MAAKLAKSKTAITNAIVALLFLGSKGGEAEELGPFLRNYELLSYPGSQLDATSSSHRVKRSTKAPADTLHVHFKAQGRDFHLVLRRDFSAFADNFVMRTSSGPVDADLSHIYSGYLDGDAGSHVFGSVIGGVFEGRITASDGRVFYAEPAWKYAGQLPANSTGHTVFYTASDVRLPPQLAAHGGCGLDRLQSHLAAQGIDLRARTTQRSRSASTRHWRRSGSHRRVRRSLDYAEPPPGTYEPRNRSGQNRSGQSRSDENRRVCHMQIVVDHVLYEFFADNVDDKTARERITALVSSHITSTNIIYSTTDFEGIIGLRFVLQDLRINDTATCEDYMAHRNPFCRNDLDATLMLHLFSHIDHDDFCLSYVWTNRDLGEGTLGLAYIALPNEPGGACEKFRTVTTRWGRKRLALNTGAITFLLHGGSVVPAVSEVTFAHEIGHSYGSLHDSTPECRPGSPLGNYIMFPRATTGLEPNNRRFSPCSRRSMGLLVRSILENKGDRENCFLAHQHSFCGNNVREDKEECDCGYEERDCRDQCCFARKNSVGAPGCTLRPNMLCSPSTGSCCTEDCHFLNTNHRCANVTQCTHESFCDSVGAHCPEPLARPNLTECNHGTQVCRKGRCEGSICEKFGYEDCQLLSTGAHSSAEMCLVSCKRTGTDGPCLDTCKEPALLSLCGKRREAGAACNQNRGYCDVFHRCRIVDENGPLARLQQLLVPNRVRELIKRYTWVAALLGVLFLLAVLLFIRCCAVLTPTNNPRLPKAKTFKEGMENPWKLLQVPTV
ncbi:disintegrin and metalloproteinase domain-containing protein 10-like isoform X3 [Dermacentor albipictus]|uniref:disintegrin and metalloproteinase domain-containing protein 10-like isoform X3 n=1 Tax=Dermacentor albipictus TaxID=60249 RepID=UPI0031FC021D